MPHKTTETPSRRFIAGLFALVWCLGHGSAAEARDCKRPARESASWISIGGGQGGRFGEAFEGRFDLGVSGDVTWAVSDDGDVRMGPWVRAQTASFDSATLHTGIELFVGAAPEKLRMFHYTGEGMFVLQAGGGATLDSRAELIGTASVTASYGYRAPFNLGRRFNCSEAVPDKAVRGYRAPSRYMTGVRLYTTALTEVQDLKVWQITGGIEFEPLGSFRYLLGMN